MTIDLTIAVISGFLVSIVFNWFPKVREWYAEKSTEHKQLIMLGVLGISTLLGFGLACLDLPSFQFGVTCSVTGAKTMLDYFLVMAIANQTAYKIIPASPRVIEIKEKRIKHG